MINELVKSETLALDTSPTKINTLTRTVGSALAVPMNRFLVQLDENEARQLEIATTHAHAVRQTAQRSLLNTDGGFSEVTQTAQQQRFNSTTFTLSDILTQGDEKTETTKTDKMWGFFVTHRRSTQSGTKNFNQMQNETQRAESLSNLAGTTGSTKDRLAKMGRSLTPESVAQVCRSYEIALDQGASFNPFETKKLMSERLSFLQSVLNIMSTQGDRLDLVSAVASSAYEMSTIGLQRMQEGLPEETLNRAEENRQQLVLLYMEIGLQEFIQGFDLLLESASVHDSAQQLMTLVNLAYEFNQEFGKKLLTRWAEKLPDQLPEVNCAFFIAYSQMFKNGVSSNWLPEVQREFLDGMSFILPTLLNHDAPAIVISTLKKFLVDIFMSDGNNAAKVRLYEVYVEQHAEELGAVIKLLFDRQVTLPSEVVHKLLPTVSAELSAKNSSAELATLLIENTKDAVDIVNYLRNLVTDFQELASADYQLILALVKRFGENEWKIPNTRFYRAGFSTDEAPVLMKLVKEGFSPILLTVKGYTNIANELSWIKKSFILSNQSVQLTLDPRLPQSYESFSETGYARQVFPDLHWLEEFIKSYELIEQDPAQVKSNLLKAIQKLTQWWGSRSAALMFDIYLRSMNADALNSFKSIVAGLRQIHGQELQRGLIEAIDKRFLADQLQELSHFEDLLVQSVSELKSIKLRFLERRMRKQIDVVVVQAEGIISEIKDLANNIDNTTVLLEGAYALWKSVVMMSRELNQIFVDRSSRLHSMREVLTASRLTTENRERLYTAYQRISPLDSYQADRTEVNAITGYKKSKLPAPLTFFQKMTEGRIHILKHLTASTNPTI